MSYTPDSPQHNSPIPFRSHTALLLSAALPFLQPAYRHSVELALKFLEFTETLKLFQEFHLSGKNPFHSSESTGSPSQEGGLFGLINTFITDPEGLLQSLSSVCTGDEREIIGMFLNMLRVKNFYESYGDLLQMPGLFSGGNPFASEPEQGTQSTDSDQMETLALLKSLFSDE